ncbi:phosphoglycolate phosphatase [Kaistia dalseonensis]|uniref:Phosphoglycolate phosphatase n=1 Tax=Kaistia dalseonensis TaxID=410840 RepID=A0ABU0H3E4_9HYPH|nr:phosphoglycolate phosphatase [Kaistia dalseonensis]MCX5494239.1 phosphoglycolate phosphatase [Kaistia dalseonensis]MDQ0436819.1 phosphoglycolate phosphatase [Kaistia dalseonensis]
MRPTLVFDLDGTLVDTAADLVATLNVILTHENLAPVPYADARSMVGHGARVLIERGLAANGASRDSAAIDRLFDAYIAHYSAHIADHSLPFPGVTDALDHFAAEGWLLAVCTNKLEGLSVQLLDALSLSSRFAAICGADTFAARKPDPIALTGTIERAGGDRRRAIMVGDSKTDIDTALAASVPVVAVDFGYTPVPVTELGPDLVISHFDELAAAVAKLTPSRG